MPTVTMIAGPNGSGKSTLYDQLRDGGISFGDYINADEIARNLSGSRTEIARRAQAEVRDKRDKAMQAGRDYCWETVMSHPSHVHHLVKARSIGYRVRLLYVALEDPKLNERRVKERVESGGHAVPSDRIRRRYYRSIDGLARAIAIAHDGRIYDNSQRDRPFIEIAAIDEEVMQLRMDWFDLPRWFIPALVSINAR